MASNLAELITNLKVKAASNDAYVYYDQATGKIHKVSGKKEDSEYDVLAVPIYDAKPILNGESNIDEYTVIYDIVEKQTRLKKINAELAANSLGNFCYELPKIEFSNINPLYKFIKEYKGIDVFIWKQGEKYNKGNFVWFDNNVYILNVDVKAASSLENISRIYIKDVYIPDVPTPTHEINTGKMIVKEQQYVGVNVDVWYDDVEHYEGQHIFINNKVYKIKKNQRKGSKFRTNNATLVEKNVKLYDDENKDLEFENVDNYELFLDNNSLYMFVEKDSTTEFENYSTDRITQFYYTSNNNIVHGENLKDNVKFTNIEELKNGSLVLLERQLYRIQSAIDVDIVLTQNKINKKWNIALHPLTKKFLKTSFANSNSMLYFSVTSPSNPNVLYRSLSFKLKEILESTVSFDFESDYETDEVSVYTSKYFNHYTHEVLE